MKLFLGVLLVLFFFLQEAACLHMRSKQLSFSFQNKVEQKLAAAPTAPPTSPPPSNNGRVFYPIGYGGDPTGEQESSDAILKAIGDAYNFQSGLQLLQGIKDLGGVIIDLQGGSYKISKPITFPPGGGNIVVQGGSLRASKTFPSDRHLLELSAGPQDGVIDYEDITFRDILFDSSYQGGGILVVDSARIRINNCFLLHFTLEGILVQGGHETFISSCFLGQHSSIGGDKGEKDYGGTGIDLASNDNAVTDVTIFSAATGIILRGQANMITGVHCYNKATYLGGVGIYMKLAGNSQTRISNSYMDYTSIVMEDPVQVHVTNGFFLGDANIVLKSIKGQILGLNIVDNMFSGDPSHNVPIVALEGQFSSIDQVVIDRNNANGMVLKSTVRKMVVEGNGTQWVADFSPLMVFPNRINYFQYSLSTQGDPKFVGHAVTNVSNNVVVIETEEAVKGRVYVLIEQ